VNKFVQLTCCICRLRLEGKFDLFKIARSTPGFVGADLKSLVDKAGNLAMKRIIDRRKSILNLEDWWRRPWDEAEMESLSITMTDFEVFFFLFMIFV
jgi:ribosome biogenesis ATPase